jgi:hypothetical protein
MKNIICETHHAFYFFPEYNADLLVSFQVPEIYNIFEVFIVYFILSFALNLEITRVMIHRKFENRKRT